MEDKILVIDAHPVYIQKLDAFVRGLTFQHIRLAASAHEGLSLAESFQPDIVLMSGIYPDRDSRETLRELKRICPQARVIVQVGLLTEHDAIEAFKDAGAMAVLIRLEKNLAPLQDALEQARLQNSPK